MCFQFSGCVLFPTSPFSQRKHGVYCFFILVVCCCCCKHDVIHVLEHTCFSDFKGQGSTSASGWSTLGSCEGAVGKWCMMRSEGEMVCLSELCNKPIISAQREPRV